MVVVHFWREFSLSFWLEGAPGWRELLAVTKSVWFGNLDVRRQTMAGWEWFRELLGWGMWTLTVVSWLLVGLKVGVGSVGIGWDFGGWVGLYEMGREWERRTGKARSPAQILEQGLNLNRS